MERPELIESESSVGEPPKGNSIGKHTIAKQSDPGVKLAKEREKKPMFTVSRRQKKAKPRPKLRMELDDSNRTILDIINDTESGIPMTTMDVIKSKFDRLDQSFKKRSSVPSEKTISVNYSNVSQLPSEKAMLKNKTDRSPVFENETNYGKFFKPKVVIDPVTGKMTVEKPQISEATEKMREEINKRNIPIVQYTTENKKLTSASFKKLMHTDRWDEEETKYFYNCLSCFGTDFSLLEIILTPRSRNQIKNKYKKEERENPTLVQEALRKVDPNKQIKLFKIFQEFKKEHETPSKLKKTPTKFTPDYRKLLNEMDIDKNQANNEKEMKEALSKENSDNTVSEDEPQEEVEELEEQSDEVAESTEVNRWLEDTRIKKSAVRVIINQDAKETHQNKEESFAERIIKNFK